MRFNGKINGKSAWILLDSGTSKNFINTKFVKQHHLPQITSNEPVTVELANGQKKQATFKIKINKLKLDQYKIIRVSAQVLELQ